MAKKQKQPFISLIAVFGLLLLVIVLAIVYGLTQQSDNGSNTPKQTKETAPLNEYHLEAFYYDNGFLRYKDSQHMIGIDVSVHQGVIDWQKVADSGIEFAIIRIGYRGSTMGGLYEDEQFRYNIEEAAKVGIKIGIYFFSQALTTEEATEEAVFVCDLLEGYKIDLPIYFDWEYQEGRIKNASDVPLTACAISFCKAISSRGFRAGVYFNQSFGYSYLDLRQLQEYHLWLAEYNETPSFQYHFDCLQYSESGQVDGIDTVVDLDLLFLPENDNKTE